MPIACRVYVMQKNRTTGDSLQFVSPFSLRLLQELDRLHRRHANARCGKHLISLMVLHAATPLGDHAHTLRETLDVSRPLICYRCRMRSTLQEPVGFASIRGEKRRTKNAR